MSYNGPFNIAAEKVTKGGDTGALAVGTNDATQLTLKTNNATRMTFSATTNEVGIGTSPASGASINTAGGIRNNASLLGSSGGLELNQYGSGDRPAWFDFHSHGLPDANDYSARIIKYEGQSTSFDIINASGNISLETDGVSRLVVENATTRPSADNVYSLGTAIRRWSVVYAGTGTINTSDARQKTPVSPLTTAEKTAASQMAAEIGTYQFLESVEQKGANARTHVGFTVQRAVEIMQANGLGPLTYGFICYDSWDAETELVEDDLGDITKEDVIHEHVNVSVSVPVINIVNGVAVQSEEIKTESVPQFFEYPLVDSVGEPVLDSDGAQIIHKEPKLVPITRRYKTVVTKEAGDIYSFRYDQLALFILRGMVG